MAEPHPKSIDGLMRYLRDKKKNFYLWFITKTQANEYGILPWI